MLAHLTFSSFAEAPCNSKLVSMIWLVLLRTWWGECCQQPQEPSTGWSSWTNAHIWKWVNSLCGPWLWNDQERARRREQREIPPPLKGYQPLPKGIAPVTVRVVFPLCRCCVLQNPLLVSTRVAAVAAARASWRLQQWGCNWAWSMMYHALRYECVLLTTACCGVLKGTDPVSLCEPCVTGYNEAPDWAWRWARRNG